MDAGLDRIFLVLLDKKGPLQHHEIYADLRVKCTSSRTFYKCYHRLINQQLIERQLTPPEQYYKYNITIQGRLILHPERQNDLQNSPKVAATSQNVPQISPITSNAIDIGPNAVPQSGSAPVQTKFNQIATDGAPDWHQAFIGLMNAIQTLNQGIQSLSTHIPSQTAIIHEMSQQKSPESSRISEESTELDSELDTTSSIASLKYPHEISKEKVNIEDNDSDDIENAPICRRTPNRTRRSKTAKLFLRTPRKLLNQLQLAVQENNQTLIQQLNQEFQRRKFTDDLWKEIVLLETLNVTNIGDLEQLKHFWSYLVKSPSLISRLYWDCRNRSTDCRKIPRYRSNSIFDPIAISCLRLSEKSLCISKRTANSISNIKNRNYAS